MIREPGYPGRKATVALVLYAGILAGSLAHDAAQEPVTFTDPASIPPDIGQLRSQLDPRLSDTGLIDPAVIVRPEAEEQLEEAETDPAASVQPMETFEDFVFNPERNAATSQFVQETVAPFVDAAMLDPTAFRITVSGDWADILYFPFGEDTKFAVWANVHAAPGETFGFVRSVAVRSPDSTLTQIYTPSTDPTSEDASWFSVISPVPPLSEPLNADTTARYYSFAEGLVAGGLETWGFSTDS